MKFGSIIPISNIDYPDNISFVIFAIGCNFKCPYCYNTELVLNKNINEISEDYILDELKNRKKFISGVVISGGEPTIYDDLPEFLNKIKKLDLNIKLDTNGSNPKMLISLLKNNLLDYIAMDIKYDPFDYNKYNEVAGTHVAIDNIFESIQIIKESKIKYQFRTTVIPEIHDIDNLYNLTCAIFGANLYVIQNFNPHNNLDPKFSNKTSFSAYTLNSFKEAIKYNVKKVEIIY